jgi:hypothetical protein
MIKEREEIRADEMEILRSEKHCSKVNKVKNKNKRA